MVRTSKKTLEALVDGEPFSMIIAGPELGFSKAISKESYSGHPWNFAEYPKVFGDQRK